MLPALPTGMQSASSSSSCSMISNAAGLLALEAVLVDGVDERDRVAVGQLAHERQRLVEVAAQRDHARAVHERLGELALGDLALRHDHRARQPGARRVGGGARGGVAGRRADDRLRALAHGGADGARHAAVLERAGRVEPLELQPDLGADELGDVRRVDERRRALAERDDGIVGRRTAGARGSARSGRHADPTGRVEQALGLRRTPRRSRGSRAARSAGSPAARSARRAAKKRDSSTRVDDHHEARVLAQALLHDGLDRRAVLAEHRARPGRARRAGRRPPCAGRTPTRRRRRSPAPASSRASRRAGSSR